MGCQKYYIGDYWPLRWEHLEDGSVPEHFADTDYYIQITTEEDRNTVVAEVELTKIEESGSYTGELYGYVDGDVTETFDAGPHIFYMRAVFPINDAPGDEPYTLTAKLFEVETAPGLAIT